jgi:hypothetical protein
MTKIKMTGRSKHSCNKERRNVRHRKVKDDDCKMKQQ